MATTNPPASSGNVFQQRGAEVVGAMTPQSTPTERNIGPLKFEGRKVTNVGAEVANVREQKLLEATKDYIDRYQNILYVHAGEQILADDQGKPREKSDKEIKEMMIATSDKDSGTYEPYTTFVCAKILEERSQAQALAKQEADSHRQSMEQSMQAFQQTAAEAQILFGTFSATTQEARVIKKADPQSPDAQGIEASIDVFERAYKAYQEGAGPIEGIRGITIGSHRLPGHEQAIVERVKYFDDYYLKQYHQFEDQLGEINKQLQTMPANDPRRQSTEEQRHIIEEERNETRDFHYDILQTNVIFSQKLSVGEKILGPNDPNYTLALQEARQITWDFVQKRQAKILGQLDAAVLVLQDEKITGLADLTEAQNLRQQYGAHEKIWLVQMGGDAKEVQRRVDWWGGLRMQERAAEQLLQTEQASLSNLAEIVQGLSVQQLNEMQQKLTSLQQMYRTLTSPPLSYPAETARTALGLPPTVEAREQIPIERRWYEKGEVSLDDPRETGQNLHRTFADGTQGIAGFFGGIGEYGSANVAAELGQKQMEAALKALPQNATPEQIQEAILEALASIHAQIVAETQAGNMEDDTGSHASVVKIWTGKNNEQKMIFANSANSRIYVRHKDGSLEQVSTDDSQFPRTPATDQATEVGKITDIDEQIAFLNRNKVRTSLGDPNLNKDQMKADLVKRSGIRDLQEGDEVIIVSNSLHNNLINTRIQEIANQNKDKSSQELAQVLCEQARLLSQFRPLAEKTSDNLFLDLGGRADEYKYANSARRAEMILEDANLTTNSLVNRQRLIQVLGEAQTADPAAFENDFGQPQVENAWHEIFPSIDRARQADISAVVLQPKSERVILQPGQPGAAAVEGNAPFLEEQALTDLRELVANLAPQNNEDARAANRRVRQEFKAGEPWYDYIEDNFGEEAAQRVSQEVQTYRGPGFFAFIFGRVLGLIQTKQ